MKTKKKNVLLNWIKLQANELNENSYSFKQQADNPE